MPDYMRPPRVLRLLIGEFEAVYSQHQKCVVLPNNDAAQCGDLIEISCGDRGDLSPCFRVVTHIQNMGALVVSLRPASAYERAELAEFRAQQAATFAALNLLDET